MGLTSFPPCESKSITGAYSAAYNTISEVTFPLKISVFSVSLGFNDQDITALPSTLKSSPTSVTGVPCSISTSSGTAFSLIYNVTVLISP